MADGVILNAVSNYSLADLLCNYPLGGVYTGSRYMQLEESGLEAPRSYVRQAHGIAFLRCLISISCALKEFAPAHHGYYVNRV